MIQHIRKHKKKITVTSVILIIVILSFFIEEFIRDSALFSEKYGVSSLGIVLFFGAAEIFFNLGIALMLIGSGVLRIRWKDIREFNLEKIHFSGPIVYLGFLLNRLAALVPWVYILSTGWGKLPIFITTLIFFEVVIVFVIGLVIRVPMKTKLNEQTQ